MRRKNACTRFQRRVLGDHYHDRIRAGRTGVVLHGVKNVKDSSDPDSATFCFTVEQAENIIKELRRATRYAKKMQELSNERDKK